MGVDGLSKYARDHNLYQVVNMRTVANDFRSRNTGEPVVAVDGPQCAWYLYRKLGSLHGGQYKEFRERCEQVVKQFQGIGLSLHFVFDGAPVEEKISTWVKRREDKAKEISKFFAKLRTAQAKGYLSCGFRILPEAVIPSASVFFKHLGCQVCLSTTDCDTELAQFAATNACCVGVLSDDSDFLIYSGVPCVFTFTGLQIGKKVRALRFQSTMIASHLGIVVDNFPAFACFVGNDIVSKKALKKPHRNLRRMYGSKVVIELVAQLLKGTPKGDVSRMCEVAVGKSGRKAQKLEKLVQESVYSYQYHVGVSMTAKNDPRWGAVLQRVKARHMSCEIPRNIFTVMNCRLMRFGDALEDLSISRPNFPPTFLALRAMRSRMYTVLLWNSGNGPFRVTEYILTKLGQVRKETVVVQKTLPEEVHHPDPLELWSGPKDHRWCTFNWVISPTKDLSVFRALSPQYLVVPTAALFYLYHEAQILTRDELRIFVIVAVSVKSLSARQLSRRRVKIRTERAIYLATLFVRAVLQVLDVAAACGLSFPRPADCHLDAYFDGKFFHHIYRKSESTSDPSALTEWDKAHERTFSRLMNIIQQC
ncbi:uncharacterized protein LOC126214959 [Schistocerca nitens]|uniref:uncharacterized protein LOC126214959 n=1 Tax=Schistocerca nitens TaxID=7011 RepID=UPI002117EA90|nr:uncharacterized protein LOC126214959 [Schistocerca nitens]